MNSIPSMTCPRYCAEFLENTHFSLSVVLYLTTFVELLGQFCHEWVGLWHGRECRPCDK